MARGLSGRLLSLKAAIISAPYKRGWPTDKTVCRQPKPLHVPLFIFGIMINIFRTRMKYHIIVHKLHVAWLQVHVQTEFLADG